MNIVYQSNELKDELKLLLRLFRPVTSSIDIRAIQINPRNAAHKQT